MDGLGTPAGPLGEALHDISAIRQQLARSTEFRGYGPVMLAATGLLAVGAGLAQAGWLGAQPGIDGFVTLWTATAAIAVLLIAVESWRRAQKEHGGLADEMLRNAFAQFVPAAMCGVLLTVAVVAGARSAAWMLPCLWQILFALGVFASCRFLPRAMYAVGIWYLVSGLMCLLWAAGLAQPAGALSPWAMAVPFASGQALAAVLVGRQKKQRL